MKIAVVLRQVPDLIEPLEIAASGDALDLGSAVFLVNEADDHALEQALLLKEKHGGTVSVVALDFGDVDNALFAAAAKGADQILKIPLDVDAPLSPPVAATLYAAALKSLAPDLVLVGVQAHDELQGVLAPWIATELGLPYLGVVHGVQVSDGELLACKEFPGAVMAQMRVQLPAALGIQGAEQPPRYVPVSRIRAAMKTTQFVEFAAACPPPPTGIRVTRLYPPPAGERAAMLAGSAEQIAAQIADLLAEKGLLK